MTWLFSRWNGMYIKIPKIEYFLKGSLNYRNTWLTTLELLKENQLSAILLLCAPEGVGKSSTGRGMLKLAEERGFTVTDKIERPADVLLLDDIVGLSKRQWRSEVGTMLPTFFRTLRTIYTMVLITAPDVEDLDKSIRDSNMLNIVRVTNTGKAYWRDPIIVSPVFKDEKWRMDVLREFSDLLNRKRKGS